MRSENIWSWDEGCSLSLCAGLQASESVPQKPISRFESASEGASTVEYRSLKPFWRGRPTAAKLPKDCFDVGVDG
jgi:hypothetical protein